MIYDSIVDYHEPPRGGLSLQSGNRFPRNKNHPPIWTARVREKLPKVPAALGVTSAAGRTDPAFFFRTSDGIELDLAIDRGDGLWIVEAKLTSNPGPGDIEKRNRAADTASTFGCSPG